MDQDTTNGSDKRSWRERLGIGAGKEMPRISEDFKPVTASSNDQRPSVKPAPMAPRVPKAGSAPPVPEKLADKLKAQRDASERLAEQRIQAARQRADISPAESGLNGNGKPKFGFAVDEQAKLAPAPPPMPKAAPASARPLPSATVKVQPAPAPPPVVTKPVTPPPPPPMQQKPMVTPQSRPVAPPPQMKVPPASMTPPRQPLGSDRTIMPPRPPMPSMPQAQPPRYNQTYVAPPMPQYRPIDPNQRYTPPLGQPPSVRGYTPPVGGYNNQPRLNVPPPPAPGGGYGNSDYAYGDQQRGQRPLRPPPPRGAGYRPEYPDSDLFEEPRGQQRRATATDYSQAYREQEYGYEDEMPRSKGPWLLLLLLLLAAAVAAGVVWFYYNNMKPQVGGQGSNAPVVQAPAQPAKAQPDQPAAQPAGQPSKKLIYDRIVGDREVLGGDVMESEEAPIAPIDAEPAADPEQGTPPATGGEDMTPLPLPPPPGDGSGSDQQGSLPLNGKTDSATIVPAAGESQAAESPKGDTPIGVAVPAPVAPVPGELPVPGTETGVAAVTTGGSVAAVQSDGSSAAVPAAGDGVITSDGSESIADTTAESEPVADTPVVEKKPAKPKKIAQKKPVEDLGAEPVVLVPPADGGQSTDIGVASIGNGTASGGGGLYDGEGVVDPAQPATPPQAQPAKKRRTLADLFRENDSQAEEPVASFDNAAAPVQTAPQKKPAPQPEQQVAAAGGYVVQLASFRSRDEANSEYRRLSGKYAVLGSLSPIVNEAQVAGSTRYRLAAGTMATREQASAVCAKLFAAGARDCQVRQQ